MKAAHIIEPEAIARQGVEALADLGFEILTKKHLSKEQKDQVSVVFVRTYTTVDKDFLDAYPNLEYVLRAGVGLDNIDLDECKKRSIRVINAPGSNADSVAEYVVGISLMMMRNIQDHIRLVRSGQWRNGVPHGFELKGKTVGLIGCGAVGSAIASKLRNFSVSIIGHDPFVDKKELARRGIIKTDFEEVISRSRIISIQVPLTADTRHLISKKELVMMRPDSFLINVSRGGVVNEHDLVRSLHNRDILGAALDVLGSEPEVQEELLELDNLILTPHIGAYTRESDERMSLQPVERLAKLPL